GERLRAAGARRPLHRERHARDRLTVWPIALECPRRDDLSAALADLAERDQIRMRVARGIAREPAGGERAAGLLRELADRDVDRGFAGLDLTLGDRPHALVAPGV